MLLLYMQLHVCGLREGLWAAWVWAGQLGHGVVDACVGYEFV